MRHWLLIHSLLIAWRCCHAAVLFSGPGQVTIDEERPLGSPVASFSVKDSAGLPVTLSLDQVDDYSYFELLQSGELRTAARLDRELRTVYRCRLLATSSNGDSKRQNVQVNLRDINDNAPVFAAPQATVVVLEDASIGTIVYRANATDADLVQRQEQTGFDQNGNSIVIGYTYTVSNGRVFYSIFSGNDESKFGIDADTGAVTVNASLLTSARAVFTLALNATDPDGRHDSAALAIRVGDANDNAPVIFSPRPFSLTLSEDTAPGLEIVAGAYANDTDFGSNAEVSFALVAGNSGEFAVNATTGRITLVGSLDYELSTVIQLVLAAQDGGKPQRQDSVTITINLLDVNDNAPAFGLREYAGSLDEGNAIGATGFLTVAASDPDGPGNGSVVRYAFEPGRDGDSAFSVNAVSGELRAERQLDRESRAEYHMVIVASDQDVPGRRRSSSVNVTVRVLDVNDNTPRFTANPFVGNLLDGATIRTVALTLNATDADEGDNARLLYSLTLDENGAFTVDAVTGAVKLAIGPASYVAKRFYNMTARVQDQGLLRKRATTVPVVVEVHEDNRNAPIFSPVVYSATVSESLPVGRSVLQVTATDLDPRQIGEVTYEISTEDPDVFRLGGSLVVDSKTGVVSVATSLDRDTRAVHVFRILAKDGGFPPRVDYANVTVTLTDANDVAPTFPADMRAYLQEHPGSIPITIYQVNATDPDLGAGGTFTFSLSPDWPTSSGGQLFTIDPTTGVISVNGDVDREVRSTYVLGVTAVDQGSPSLQSGANVTLLITDVNDKPPYFTTNYTASVAESTTAGTPVATVSALDDDIGINAISTYSIIGGNGRGHFAVNGTSGVVSVAAALDRETTDRYALILRATDSRNPAFTGTAQLELTVLDVNDNPPLFAATLLVYNVSESALVNSVIFSLSATDSDVGNALFYNVSDSPTGDSALGYFSVSPATGDVTLTRQLDRETRSRLTASVWVTDGVFTSNASLRVNILDHNDVVPRFSRPRYNATVSEDVAVGTSIVTVSATDGDVDVRHRTLRYRLLGGDPYGWFAMNATSGVLTNVQALDREALDVVNLTVAAVNLASPNLTGVATVAVSLDDVNDSPPDFGPSPRVVAIAEGGALGNSAGFVNASDPDLLNGTVWYSIVDDNTHQAARINPTSGEIYLTYDLDFERQSVYYIVVRADDRGIPPLFSVTNATLRVLDVNDNAPSFSAQVYRVTVPESASVGSSVAQLLATDLDSTSNGALLFSMSSSSTAPFSVHPTSGLVTVTKSLDRETTDSYNFTVSVTDGGVPPLGDAARLEVTVEDVNDSPPQFLQSSYSASLAENMAVGTVVTRVQAVDADVGVNGVVTYSIVGGNGDGHFAVHATSGVLRTAARLDREVKETYSLTLRALNSAASIAESTTVTVAITVLDLNDNRPHLTGTPPTVTVNEISLVGSQVASTPYVDGDKGANGQVTFTITGGNDNQLFRIDASSGAILLNGSLDYETRRVYAIIIDMQDGGNPPLTGRGSLFIDVADGNDHPPVFAASAYKQTVATTETQGNDIFKVVATDMDSGTNGAVSYSAAGGTATSFVTVTTVNGVGEVQLAQDASTLVVKQHDLVLNASDGVHIATTTVTFYIQDTSVGTAFASKEYVAHLTTLQQTQNQAILQYSFSGSGSPDVFIDTPNITDFFVHQPSRQLGTAVPSLDYYRQHFYQFTLRLQDATSGEQRFTQVRVTLEEKSNRFPPVLPASRMVIEVAEHPQYQDYQLARIPRQDLDVDAAANFIQFVQLTTSLRNLFYVTTFGRVELNNPLDYEHGQRSYDVEFEARNSRHLHLLTARATINFLVTEANEAAPRFAKTTHTFSIAENAPASLATAIVTPVVTDSDFGSSGEVTFALVDDVVSGGGNFDYLSFAVNASTGQVFQAAVLDYERDTEFHLLLVAQDGGNPGMSSGAIVYIKVLDVNDNYPVFNMSSYPVNLYENTTIGSLIVVVTATDRDQIDRSAAATASGSEILNGFVTYSVAGGNGAGHIALDTATGRVTLASMLDVETMSLLTVVIRATDGGGLYVDVDVILTVLDNNDNTPVFGLQLYATNVSEDAPLGVDLVQVTAVDADREQAHSDVQYAIVAGNTGAAFRINSTSGWITTAVSLDRETTARYDITVQASDGGIPRRSQNVTVKIDVVDINEFPPTFTGLPFTASIPESSVAGFQVFRVSSTDQDFGVNATPSYSIVSGNDLEHFRIDVLSGAVTVNQTLDFETLASYNLTIRAKDMAPLGHQFSATASLAITLIDVNDNSPVFLDASYSLSVLEAALAGKGLVNVSATDADSGTFGQIQSYQLVVSGQDDAGSRFQIDGSTGRVSLLSAVDRERFASYNITLRATDGGGRSTDSFVVVTVLDFNDNAPVFPDGDLLEYVSENATADTPVVTVRATDQDAGENAALAFALLTPSSEVECAQVCPTQAPRCQELFSGPSPSNASTPRFAIAPLTGAVTSIASLDRESIPVFVVQVTATDNSTLGARLSGTTCLVVNVTDVNDNTPAFSRTSYAGEVQENLPSGTSILTVTASDRDAGSNAAVTYSISTQGAGSLFSVDAASGVLSSATAFDREMMTSWQLIVAVSDGGASPKSSSVPVTVNVTDANDNRPRFVYATSNSSEYDVSVYEDLPSGVEVLRLSSTDADVGLNAAVRYAMVTAGAGFNVTEDGRVLVDGALDRELQPRYNLSVSVTDRGTPPLTSQTNVIITLLDVNDNAPVFSETPYQGSVNENATHGHEILTVSATDADLGTNAVIRFSVVQSGSATSPLPFSITPLTGVISVTGSLDAETTPSYALNITATDMAAGVGDRLSTTVTVQVTFLDVNDFRPVFASAEYRFAVVEGGNATRSVFQLTASDGDATSPNNRVSYEIDSFIEAPLPGSPFRIDAATGVVYLSRTLDRETRDLLWLTVRAEDGGLPTMFGRTNVTVVVLDSNDHFPVFQQPSYAFSVGENEPPAVAVGNVSASDLDLNNVTYSIANDTSDDGFVIDEWTGEITTGRPLDRERNATHELDIVASDGLHVRSPLSITTVYVTVLDRNDEYPTFVDPDRYSAAVPESLPVASPVISVLAVDLDDGTNAVVQYSLLSSNDSSQFAVNISTGQVSLATTLDFEQQERYSFQVVASDSGSPPLSRIVAVNVTILDVNDNSPVFSSAPGYASVVDENTLSAWSFQVLATDADSTSNSELTYSIVGGNSGDDFAIDNQTGLVSIEHSLDFERTSSYNLSLLVEDLGQPSRNASSLLRITVVDLNDNSPAFGAPLVNVTVSEATPLYSRILSVVATDADSTTNAQLRYFISAGNSKGHFSIMEADGDLILTSLVDRERQATYRLVVTAEDAGVPLRASTQIVQVIVADVNDDRPGVSTRGLAVTVLGNATSNAPVFTVAAVDRDEGVNSRLQFAITDGNSAALFAIDSSSGVVRTTRAIATTDRDTQLSVVVSDGGIPQMQDRVVLTIGIRHLNVNAPRFATAGQLATVATTAIIGSHVAFAFAQDGDFPSGRSAVLAYSIDTAHSGGIGSSRFSVDSRTGAVAVQSSLTGLENTMAVVAVCATDGQLSACQSVNLSFVASADRAFAFPSYSFSVKENASASTAVGAVMMANADNYRIRSGDDGQQFAMTSSGGVMLAAGLDYETQQQHILVVSALDSASGELAHVVVRISVEDVNEFEPEFAAQRYQVTVPESSFPGLSVLALASRDRDLSAANSLVEYAIESGDPFRWFRMDARTGEIFTRTLLDRETAATLLLNVSASNYASCCPLSSFAMVAVTVADANDHAPTFEGTSRQYHTAVLDDAQLGDPVMTVNATDPDVDYNGLVFYAIKHTTAPRLFAINSSSGTITITSALNSSLLSSAILTVVAGDFGTPASQASTAVVYISIDAVNRFAPAFTSPLSSFDVLVSETSTPPAVLGVFAARDPDGDDRLIRYALQTPQPQFTLDALSGALILTTALNFRTTPSFNLSISAADQGNPLLQSAATITVTVRDENNHDPAFKAMNYTFVVPELASIGTVVTQLVATDDDATSITYAISRNVLAPNGQDLFLVNSSSGELSLAAMLDHETATSYDIEVFALDHGYGHRRSTRLRVRILVDDENDNYPRFLAVPLRLNMSRFLPPGHVVADVNATDADQFHGYVTFSLTRGNGDGLLGIDPITGLISVTSRPGPAARERYNVTVSASDGRLVTDATVDVRFDYHGDFCLPNVCYATAPSRNCSDDGNATTSSPIGCTACPVGWASVLDGDACAFPYCPSAGDWVCAAAGSANGTCVPLAQPCEGTRCRATTHSLCEPTRRCLPLGTMTSCDNSSATTCLVEQALVERERGARACEHAATLSSTTGRSCTAAGTVFCALRDRCINANVPDPCVQCRAPLLECPKTGVCTLDTAECCDSGAALYCNFTRSCRNASVACVLVTTEPPSVTPTPNSAPVLRTNMLYGGEVRRDSYANPATAALLSDGFGLSQLLLSGSNGRSFANDSDGDLLGLAVTGVSLAGGTQWQYAECAAASSVASGCSASAWTDFPSNRSAENALLLGPRARVRPVVTASSSGAAWFEAHAFDGTTGGLQNTAGNGTDGASGETTRISATGGATAFSAGRVTVIVVVQPAIEYPSVHNSSLTLDALLEDTPVHLNDGTPVSALLPAPVVTRLTPGDASNIANLPVSLAGLPSANLSDYFAQVRRVNSIIAQRSAASQSGSQPGLVATFQPSGTSGRWQISPLGTLDTWYYVDQILGSGANAAARNVSVFVDQRSRLRFLPRPNFYGSPPAVSVLAWDGVTTAPTQALPLRAVATSSLSSAVAATSVSESAQVLGFAVINEEDRVATTQDMAGLASIPYRIRYDYGDVFAMRVERESGDLRTNTQQLANAMLVVLQYAINILRIEPVTGTSSEVLFNVSGNAQLSYIQQEVATRWTQLSVLGFSVSNITDSAYFGRGASCTAPPAAIGPNNGMLVEELAEMAASDADETPVGIAIVGSRASRGSWQYLLVPGPPQFYFSSVSATSAETLRRFEEAKKRNVSRSAAWQSLPPMLSPQRALLLHARDRVRYVPNPDYYWATGGSNSPSLQMKFWDIHQGGQSGQLNVNTDCYVKLTNSTQAPPCSAFSAKQIPLLASRLGCDGKPGSNLVHDGCCVCGGSGGPACLGCGATVGSNKVRDSCDLCDGDASSCLGCDFVPFSGQASDACGVCRGNETARDCQGVCFGPGVRDECGECAEGTASRSYNEARDCTGLCYGNATVDACGDCSGGTTDLATDYRLDCTGTCGGPFRRDPHCGVCRDASAATGGGDYRDCAAECFGTARRDQCGVCINGSAYANATLDVCGVCGGGGSTCDGCDGAAGSGQTTDRCGQCNGHDCGCFRLYDLSPRSGPLSGGTRVTVQGAGFFVNHTGSAAFDAGGRPLPFCGGIISTVPARNVEPRCQFRGAVGTSSSASARLFDQRTMECFTARSPAAGSYKVSVRVDKTGAYNTLEDIDARFVFIDTAPMTVDAAAPSKELTTAAPLVAVTASNLVRTGDVRCLLANMTSCGTEVAQLSRPDGYWTIVPEFVNSTLVRCRMPTVPRSCRVTLFVSIDGQRSGIVRTASGAPTLFTYEFRPPTMRSSELSGGLSTVLVTWNERIELDTGRLTKCSQVFADVAMLGGDAATCSWQSDSQQAIVVVPSSSATLTLGSRLRTVDGVVRTRHEAHPQASVGDVVTVTGGAPRPEASITGTNAIPSCGSVAVRGFATGTLGYRATRFLWGVATQDGSTPGLAALQSMARAASLPNGTTLTLTSSLFQASIDYYVHLSVVNSASVKSHAARHLLRKTGGSEVVLLIDGPPQVRLSTAESAVFYSRLSHSSCTLPLSAVTLWQLWERTTSSLLADRLVRSTTTSSSTFLVNASTLAAGSYYAVATASVRRRVAFGGDATVTTTASRNISVSVPSLRVVIQGGERSVSVRDDLSLSALLLTGRDGETFSSPSYIWRCFSGSVVCEDSQHWSKPLMLPDTAHLAVPRGTLMPNRVYEFGVEVRVGRRNATASCRVSTTTVANPPGVRVLSTQTPVALESRTITLSASVLLSTATSVNITWQSVAGAGLTQFNLADAASTMMSSKAQLFTNSSNLYIVSQQLAVVPGQEQHVELVLAANALSSNRKYLVNVTLAEGNASSSASIRLTATPAPVSGVLTVSPTSGDEGTEFTLRATDWQDEIDGNELLYRFAVELPSTQRHWLTEWRTESSLTCRLPSGIGLKAVAEIRNKAGAVAGSTVPVNVAQGTGTADALSQTSYTRAQDQLWNFSDWSAALQQLATTTLQVQQRGDVIGQSRAEQWVRLFADAMKLLPRHGTAVQHALNTASALLQSTGSLSEPTADSLLRSFDALLSAESTLATGKAMLPDTTSAQASANPTLLRNAEGTYSPDEAATIVAGLSALVRLAPASRRMQSLGLLRKSVQQVSAAMCKTMAFQERPVAISASGVNVVVERIVPTGLLCSDTSSDVCVNFGSQLEAAFGWWGCGRSDGSSCRGACMVRSEYDSQVLHGGDATVPVGLQSAALTLLDAQYPGRNLSAVALHSARQLSVSVLHPGSGQEFGVVNRTQALSVQLPLPTSAALLPGSHLVCAHRALLDTLWSVDTAQAAAVMTTQDGRRFARCDYNHLTQFAVVRVPPPLPTTPPPPSTQPVATTTTPTAATMRPTTAPATTTPTTSEREPPTSAEPVVGGTQTGAIAGAVVGACVIAVLVICLVVLLMKKKRRRKRMIAEAPVDGVLKERDIELVAISNRPKTAVVSNDGLTVMAVMALEADGSRRKIGDITVLPTTRLRKLRNDLLDQFGAGGGNDSNDQDPNQQQQQQQQQQHLERFYFLTRDLSDIEPGLEQGKFVSTVYEDTVFVKQVLPGGTGLSRDAAAEVRRHFCTCGKVAQFECSECGARGYCSQDCQTTDWSSEHQAECKRLAEQKSRQRIISRRGSTLQSTFSYPDGGGNEALFEKSASRRTSRPMLSSQNRQGSWKEFLGRQTSSTSMQLKSPVLPVSSPAPDGSSFRPPAITPGAISDDSNVLVPDRIHMIVQDPAVRTTSVLGSPTSAGSPTSPRRPLASRTSIASTMGGQRGAGSPGPSSPRRTLSRASIASSMAATGSGRKSQAVTSIRPMQRGLSSGGLGPVKPAMLRQNSGQLEPIGGGGGTRVAFTSPVANGDDLDAVLTADSLLPQSTTTPPSTPMPTNAELSPTKTKSVPRRSSLTGIARLGRAAKVHPETSGLNFVGEDLAAAGEASAKSKRGVMTRTETKKSTAELEGGVVLANQAATTPTDAIGDGNLHGPARGAYQPPVASTPAPAEGTTDAQEPERQPGPMPPTDPKSRFEKRPFRSIGRMASQALSINSVTSTDMVVDSAQVAEAEGVQELTAVLEDLQEDDNEKHPDYV